MNIPIYNVDRIVSPKDYAHLKPNQLLVHGEFYTLQGEGPYAGHPAYFVRLAGCNYGDKEKYCRQCDTNFDFDKGQVVNVDDIAERAAATKATIIVVTGGEPLLQAAGLEALGAVATQRVQVETNGVYFKEIARIREAYSDLTFVVSPKPSYVPKHSSEYVAGYSPNLMKGILSLVSPHEDVFLKFLVGTDAPYNEIPELDAIHERNLEWAVYLSPVTVYKRSPHGEVANAWDPTLVDHEKTAANHALAAKWCMDYGFRLSMQMHNFCLIA